MLIKTSIFCILATCVFGQVLNTKEEVVSYRLPKNIKPIRYNVTIIPNFDTNRFSGSVSIEIEALENSSSIIINYYMIDMPKKEEIVVRLLDTNKSLPVVSAGPAEKPDPQFFFRIDLAEELKQGLLYTLILPNFSANFREVSGIIKTTFFDADGVVRPYIFTHFQPNSARAAFPCFDEPALRAKFNIRLVRPNNNYISAANTPMISQSISAPFEDVFEETVLMPTYLVSFTISEMRFSETLNRCRIIAKPQALIENKHKYALNITEKVLHFMEDYTNVPFTLSKLDGLATIGFGGGMENWGLIVYHEDYVLENKNNKQSMVMLMAHEVAHQWFGNLIGLTWWEYVWLSEGFATYFHTLTQDQVEPLIDGRGLFLNDLQIVFKKDMGRSTRPLNHNIEYPGSILLLFDDIAYKKGAAMLHMLENVLSTSIFKKGVQYYVMKMQFKQVTPLDLYESLQKAADESSNFTLGQSLTVADMMSSWDSVSGFPVVNVTRNYGSNNNNIKLAQKKYISESEGGSGQWIIPINFATRSNPSFEDTAPQHWMTEAEQTITLLNLKDNEWLIANKKETGYYRVNYDEVNWKLITQVLLTNHLEIHVLNRAQLIDDSINLANTGRLNHDIAMKLVSYIEKEKDPIPWKSYNMNMRMLGETIYYSPIYNVFREYNFNITRNVYEYLGFEENINESPLTKDLRSTVLNLLCKLDHPDCINKSLNKFKKWQRMRKSISELDELVICGAIRGGNLQDFNYLFNLVQNSDLNINAVKGLSCSKNLNNLNRLLEVDFQIPINEVIEIVSESGPEGLEAAVNFVAKNFVALEERLQERTGIVIQKLCEKISTDNQLHKLRGSIRNARYTDLLQPYILEANRHIKWRKLSSANLENYFLNKM